MKIAPKEQGVLFDSRGTGLSSLPLGPKKKSLGGDVFFFHFFSTKEYDD